MPVLTKINTNSIADDAITAEKYALEASGYVANSTNQDISGTYSDNRLYTSDAYTLSGNATINSNLILSTVKGDATDVVLTASGAYTITGTGTLEGGSILGKRNKDLTGMTGELGSAVTGAPNLNLLNTTEKAGHVIQMKHDWHEGTITMNSSSTYYSADVPITITPKYSDSMMLIQCGCTIREEDVSGTGWYILHMERRTASQALRAGVSLPQAIGAFRKLASGSYSQHSLEFYQGKASGAIGYDYYHSMHKCFIDYPRTTAQLTYDMVWKPNYSGTWEIQKPTWCTVQEIKS